MVYSVTATRDKSLRIARSRVLRTDTRQKCAKYRVATLSAEHAALRRDLSPRTHARNETANGADNLAAEYEEKKRSRMTYGFALEILLEAGSYKVLARGIDVSQHGALVKGYFSDREDKGRVNSTQNLVSDKAHEVHARDSRRGDRPRTPFAASARRIQSGRLDRATWGNVQIEDDRKAHGVEAKTRWERRRAGWWPCADASNVRAMSNNVTRR